MSVSAERVLRRNNILADSAGRRGASDEAKMRVDAQMYPTAYDAGYLELAAVATCTNNKSAG